MKRKSMTDEEINKAIAEACGIIGKDQWGPMYRTKYGIVRNCPDYCNDLNAMHEAESALSPEQVADYVFKLHLHTLGADLTAYDGDMSKAAPYFFPVIHATSRHRAEAFLRTLGLWED